MIERVDDSALVAGGKFTVVRVVVNGCLAMELDQELEVVGVGS